MNMYKYENEYKKQGYKFVCGVDEAGRGPLAGPVFAAAVILKDGLIIEGLNDSKKLSEKKREILFKKIIENSICYAIESANEKEIDKINILNATFLAMKRAINKLSTVPDIVLVDGNRLPELNIKASAIVKGDSLSASIAAASILAKVSRDRFMVELSKKYPEYKFEQHKGYPTKLHYELINKHGITDIHRKTFLKKIIK